MRPMLAAFLLPLACLSVLEARPLAQDELFAESHRALPPGDDVGGSFGAGDFDGDGWVDLLRVDQVGAGRLVLNRWGEFESAPTLLPDLGTLPLGGVAVGDLDGDGDLDAFVAESGPGHVLLWGAAGFQSQPFATGPFAGGWPSLGDFDGDGDLDVFLGVWSLGDWTLARNDGAGGFTDATSLLPPLAGSNPGEFGDVDGDGDLDLMPSSSLFLNTGLGFLDGTAGLPAVATAGVEKLADVDGDGDLDAVRVGVGTSLLWLGDGAGTFVDSAGAFPASGDDTSGAALGDVDGDGDVDLLCAGWTADHLYANDGAGHFTESPFPDLPQATASLVLADLDADGDLDAALARDAGDRLLRNDGTGAFTDATDPFPLPVAETRDVALVDADRDGHLDVYAVNVGDDSLWLGSGDGRFASASGAFLADPKSRAVVAADLTGDGYVDLAVGDEGHDFWLRNTGVPGGLFARAALPGDAATTEDLAAGDVDGDGDLDLVLANSGARDQLVRYAGVWTFQDTTAASMPASTATSIAVQLVDVDLDGDLDALLAGDSARILANDGTGAFSESVVSSGPAEAFLGGDLDGDGDVDLFVARPGADQLLLATGGGYVDASAQLPPDTLPKVEDALLLDVDGDGDLDVVATGCEPGLGVLVAPPCHLVLLANDGAATFADASARISADAAWATVKALAAGDLDGDLDPDLVGGTDDSYEDFFFGFQHLPQRGLILPNRTRHLVAPALPGLGKDVRFTVSGPPLQPWFVAWSAAEASVVLPPYGTLLLDPATLHVAALGALDAAGAGAWIAPVPATSALIDASLHWQGLVGAPLRLTNREKTTFVDL